MNIFDKRRHWLLVPALGCFFVQSVVGAPVLFNLNVAPTDWAVRGGSYRFNPVVQNSGSAPLVYKLMAPSWLSWDGVSISGTVPLEREGCIESVSLTVTNADGESDSLNYTIRVGRLVGPVASPPGGGQRSWVYGMPVVARPVNPDGSNGWDQIQITGVENAIDIPVFWGFKTNGFAMKMNYAGGPSGTGGPSPGAEAGFPVSADFRFAPGEIGMLQPLASNLAEGKAVWKAQTNKPASIGGAVVDVYLRADAWYWDPLVPAIKKRLSFLEASQYGLDSSVGALLRIPDHGELALSMWLNANDVYQNGTAALKWFNDLPMKNATDRTITQVSSGFYWVDTAPRLVRNTRMEGVADGGSVVLTSLALDAEDEEDEAGLSFVLADGIEGGPPRYGTLEVLGSQTKTWKALLAGESFTLQQLEAGEVRYTHDGGNFAASDRFQFRVMDAQGLAARVGDETLFEFEISISSPAAPFDPQVTLPKTIHYQGRVAAGGGRPLALDKGYFVFALMRGSQVLWNNWQGYRAPADPSATDLGVAHCIPLDLDQGVFSVRLGSDPVKNQPIPPSLLVQPDTGGAAGGVKLAVWFSAAESGTYTRLDPDMELSSAPYAIVAGVAEKVLPGKITEKKLAENAGLAGMPVDSGVFSTNPDDEKLRKLGFVRLAEPISIPGVSDAGPALYFYRKAE